MNTQVIQMCIMIINLNASKSQKGDILFENMIYRFFIVYPEIYNFGHWSPYWLKIDQ